MFRRRPVVVFATSTVVALVLVLVAQGQVPELDGSPNAVARTGGTVQQVLGLPAYAVVPYGSGLAPTPPMGWNPYNRFGRNVTDALVRATARAMVESGMAELGYKYVNLDGGWDLLTRGPDGEIQPDPKKFPHGIQALADYVHSLGLKFGIYASAGYRNCAGTSAGSYGHYQQDADTFADWGVDYVKLDWCHMPAMSRLPSERAAVGAALARSFGDALAATGRAIVLDVNDLDDASIAHWARGLGNLWRTTPDIQDSYAGMLANFTHNVSQYSVAKTDHWNDPDMLETGNGSMTWTEYQAEFSLWSEMAAPLIVGTDLTHMKPETLSILTNDAVIAVDQDPLGVQGYPVSSQGGRWVLTKPLADGDRAVVLFNQTGSPVRITTSAAQVGFSSGTLFQLRDLWTGLTGFTRGGMAAVVPAHGVVMYIVSPEPTPQA